MLQRIIRNISNPQIIPIKIMRKLDSILTRFILNKKRRIMFEGCNFFPNHIKVDIDGNELLVLCGATKTLNNPNCKSVLVELFEDHPEYQQCIEIFQKNGFVLLEKSHSAMFDSDPLKTENHIFVKH